LSESESLPASLSQPVAPVDGEGGGGGARTGLGFLDHVNLVFLTYVASAGLAFGVQVLLARALGPHGRGVYALFLLTAAMAQSVLGLGMSVSAVYYLGKRRATVSRVVGNGQIVVLVSGVVCSLLVLLAWPVLGDTFVEHGVPYWTFAFVVPLFVNYGLLTAVLQGSSRFLAMNTIILAQPIVQFGLLAAAVALGDIDTTSAVLFWAGGTFAATLLALGLLGRPVLRWSELLRVDREGLREQVRFGLRGQVGNVTQLLNYRLDQFIVLLFVNTAGVGIYAVAVGLTQGVWFFANAVATVLLPRLTATDEADAARTTPLICRTTLLVSALAALALAGLSPWFLARLFGHDYGPSLTPLLWLLPGTVALAGSKILTSYVFSQGYPGTNSLITIASLAVTLVADFALIPPFGVAGAAVASTLAYGTHFALSLLAYRRLSGGSIWEAVVVRGEDLRRYLAVARERFAAA
jgi:O-antigen/teichoic acid export membrane protein